MLIAILVLLSLWLGGRFALRREGRTVATLVGTVLAPFGRIVCLPTGTELMAGKKYHFGPSKLYEPARVWIGWWNCRSFAADPTRYYFFDRRSRYAIRVDAIPPQPELTMQMALSSALAGLGLMASIAGALARRRASARRRSGRQPDTVAEIRATRILAVGLFLLMLALAGLLRT